MDLELLALVIVRNVCNLSLFFFCTPRERENKCLFLSLYLSYALPLSSPYTSNKYKVCLCYIRPDETRLHYVQLVNKRNGVKGNVDVATCALEKLSKSRDGYRVRQDQSVVATISVSANTQVCRRRLEIPRGNSYRFPRARESAAGERCRDLCTNRRRNRNAGAGRKRKPLFLHSFTSFSFSLFCNKCSRRHATRVPRQSCGSFLLFSFIATIFLA